MKSVSLFTSCDILLSSKVSDYAHVTLVVLTRSTSSSNVIAPLVVSHDCSGKVNEYMFIPQATGKIIEIQTMTSVYTIVDDVPSNLQQNIIETVNTGMILGSL